MERFSKGCTALLVFAGLAGCSSEALPLSSVATPAETLSAQPVTMNLLGLQLGEGGVLLACAGRVDPHTPCLSPLSEIDPLDAGDGLYALHLDEPVPLGGVQTRGSALRLGDTVESVGVVVDGEASIEQARTRLDTLCGEARFSSQLTLEDGNNLQASAWQCRDAWVTLNALGSGDTWHASLVFSTERGRNWLEQSQATINEEAMAALSAP